MKVKEELFTRGSIKLGDGQKLVFEKTRGLGILH
jgi:hypothetical protein